MQWGTKLDSVLYILFSGLLFGACIESGLKEIKEIGELGEPTMEVVDLTTSKGNHFFIKQITVGLTGDNLSIYVSGNDTLSNQYVPTNDLVFKEYDSFFFRFLNDTLYITTMKKYTGEYKLPAEVVVVQNEIDNVEFQNLFNQERYKDRGWQKILSSDILK